MAPKAVDAKGALSTGTERCRGHGPLLQQRCAIHTADRELKRRLPVGGAHGPESGYCEEALSTEIERFRGHGPLLQVVVHHRSRTKRRFL
jgi:hypothetical protein